MTNTEKIAVWPPEARKQEIPYHVVLWLIGAIPHLNYKTGDGCSLELNGQFHVMSKQDFDTVVQIGTQLDGELPHRLVTPDDWMFAHKRASQVLSEMDSQMVTPAVKMVMLKDKGGAGYWRMVLPARHMEQTLAGTVQIDVTAAAVKFEHLLEYDTIFVQRLHDWDSFYVLEKLKKAGRRIVYDMDDDIFSLTPDNPAFHTISRDNQQAAVACMKLADSVTTTTAVLQNRLMQVVDGVVPLVIPNALDTDDNWLPTTQTGSPDGLKRIFWQGSATHAEDWLVCIDAIDRILKERALTHLVILGYLPPAVIERLHLPHWRGKVEHVGFSDVETYFELVHHVRAEVGIAPLSPKQFNEAKSPIKWLEYTCIGMPTVASHMEPYLSVIDNQENGLLAADTPEWYQRITECLDDPEKRRQLLVKAREDAKECYDIKAMAAVWQEVLLPSLKVDPLATTS